MNWRPFDTASFLKASKHWDAELKKLQQELDDMPELPAVNNESGIRSTTPSDITAQTALRRLRIAARIEEIRFDKEMLNRALKRLTEDERAIVDGFYFGSKPVGTFVWEYGRDNGMCETYVYAERKRVLTKIGAYLETKYE